MTHNIQFTICTEIMWMLLDCSCIYTYTYIRNINTYLHILHNTNTSYSNLCTTMYVDKYVVSITVKIYLLVLTCCRWRNTVETSNLQWPLCSTKFADLLHLYSSHIRSPTLYELVKVTWARFQHNLWEYYMNIYIEIFS